MATPARATYLGRCANPKALVRRLRYRSFRGCPPKFGGECCRMLIDFGLFVLHTNGDVQFLGHDAGQAQAELTGLLESEVR